MKKVTLVLVVTFLLTSCGPKATWDYVVIGDNLQLLSTVVSQYAAYIEKDQRIEIVIHDYSARSHSASLILRYMIYDDEFRQVIAEAEVITLNWHVASADLPESNFIKGECGGSNNQDCLREGYDKAKNDWADILDIVATLRNGSPTILRIMVVGDWANETGFYGKQLSNEHMQIFNSYFVDMQIFIIADADVRGIPILLVFPGPYYNDEIPLADYFLADGIHLSDLGSKIIADGLRELGYESLVLK